MRVLKLLITVTLVTIALQACKKTSEPPRPTLTVNKTNLNLASGGQKDSIIITSTEPWNLSIPAAAASWLTSDKNTGSPGTTTVNLTAKVNFSNTPNSTTVTINSLGAPVNSLSITVNQSHDVVIDYFFDNHAPGGGVIKIQGRGFSNIPAENIVQINGMNSIVQSASNTILSVTVPPKADTGPIIVTVNTKSDTTDTDFIYDWIGIVTIVAGGTEGSADGIGTAAQFSHPEGIGFDAAGNLYVADYNNSKVRKITTSGLVTTLPGRIPAWYNPTGPNTDYALPTDVAIDASGNIYITELNSSSISKISPAGTVSLFAGGNSPAFADGTGTAASFYYPVDVVPDALGNLYVADQSNNRIRKITPAGVVTTIAGGIQGFAEGTGTTASFNLPMGIDIDTSGNLYVADYYNNRIRKITPLGVVTTIAGNGFIGSTNGPAMTAQFYMPQTIAIDAAGVLYVGESDSDNEIRRITPNNKVSSVVSYIDATTGVPVNFSSIRAIDVDSNGIIYVADYNNRICKLTIK